MSDKNETEIKEEEIVEEKEEKEEEAEEEEESTEEKDIFPDLSAEERPTEIESLCINCGENGMTKLLLIKIPFFKEIIVSAFDCPLCHYSNNEVQSAGQIHDKGCEYTLRVTKLEDFNRSIVKTETCTFRLEELDFEIPADTQKGSFSTLEGIVQRARDGLEQDQPVRRIQYPDVAAQIDAFIQKLNDLLTGKSFPFTVKLHDVCGNSFIQNPYAPKVDPYLKAHYFTRSAEEDAKLGIRPQDYGPNIVPPTSFSASSPNTNQKIITNETFELIKQKLENISEDENIHESVLEMPCECNSCNASGFIKMKMLDIPYFKEIVIMAFTCDNCGYRTNEVKAGGAISEFGRKYVLKVKTAEDMSRDILKSETATVEVPELELELGMGSLGGKFTTVEGLLRQICDELSKNPFILGDSSKRGDRDAVTIFLTKFNEILDEGKEFTLIIDDPVGNSYIQNIYAPDPDPFLTITSYVRNEEQNDELGISDMVTEGYYKEDEEEKKDEEKKEEVKKEEK